MSLNGLSEDTAVSAGDGLSLSTAGVMTADVLQSEVDAKQATVTAGTGLSFSGATLNAEVTQAELDDKQNAITAGDNLSFSGATLNAFDGYSVFANIGSQQSGAKILTTNNNLVAGRVLVVGSAGKINTKNSVSEIEVSYLDGVSSNIQTSKKMCRKPIS